MNLYVGSVSCNSYSDKKLFKIDYSNNSQIVNVDNHALCDNLDIIKSETCQSNKHGRDKMPTSESQHVVSILKAFFVFFRKAIESCDRELLFYSKFCNTSN